MSQFREMRMFVIFDLPTKTKEDIRIYNKFRRSIKKEGFIMIQYSVYCRFCRNDTEYSKYLRRVKTLAPQNHGSIRIFQLTEKQYKKMHVISKRKKSDEELLSIESLVVI